MNKIIHLKVIILVSASLLCRQDVQGANMEANNLQTHSADTGQHYHPTEVVRDTIKKQRGSQFQLSSVSGKLWNSMCKFSFRLSSPVLVQIPLGVRSPSCPSQTWAWGRRPPGEGPCSEALQTPLKGELSEATAQSIISQKESLSRPPLRQREQPEDQREARTPGIL